MERLVKKRSSCTCGVTIVPLVGDFGCVGVCASVGGSLFVLRFDLQPYFVYYATLLKLSNYILR